MCMSALSALIVAGLLLATWAASIAAYSRHSRPEVPREPAQPTTTVRSNVRVIRDPRCHSRHVGPRDG